MSETTPDAPSGPPYEDIGGAPHVYFDLVAAHGVLNGAIQIELAGRVLVAMPDGSATAKLVTTGRLRCSPHAADQLRQAIEGCMKMLAQPQGAPAAASSTLN